MHEAIEAMECFEKRPQTLNPKPWQPGKMKDIIKAMESFNDNLIGGKKLVKALERDTVCALLSITAPYPVEKNENMMERNEST